jgi:hypothetical protein
MTKIKTHGFFMLSTLDGSKDILLFVCRSHANLVINTSCILLYLSKALCIECNHRLQKLLLGELIQGSILWLVTKKLVIPFFCVNYLLLAYSIRALWAPTSKALQISPDIHPLNQHHLLCLTSLTYLPITWGRRWHVTWRCFKGKIQVPSHQDIWYLP